MKEDSAGSATSVTEAATAAGAATIARPALQIDPQHLIYCRCGYPLHPDRLEMRHGKEMERWSCPERRWWNYWLHPHTWMGPREHVPL